MAKFDLKFKAADSEKCTIETFVNSDFKDIVIVQRSETGIMTIILDKSTSIKFAKTLRTEINKIKDPNHVIDYVDLFKDKIEHVIHIPNSNTKKGGKNG